MQSIGTLGGTYGFGLDISRNGTVVVGQAAIAGDAALYGMKYQNGVMTALPKLLGTGNYTANGVSDDGSIIVGTCNVGGVRKAVVYQGNTCTYIGSLTGNTAHNSFCIGVSGDGSVIAGFGRSSTGFAHAFRYANGTFTDLGVVGGNSVSNAFNISNDGTTIVGQCFLGSTSVGFFWKQSTGMVSIGYPDPTTTPYSIANAVSADGSVIVGQATFTENGVEVARACTYINGAFTNIGTLPGLPSSIAQDVSADGRIITGICHDGSDPFNPNTATLIRGFRYENGIMIDIGSLGRMTGTIRMPDSDLSTLVYGISPDGQYITGTSEMVVNGVLSQPAFLYGPYAFTKQYYDDNQKYVAQARKDQNKFSDASSYTQFLKARASGSMVRYQR